MLWPRRALCATGGADAAPHATTVCVAPVVALRAAAAEAAATAGAHTTAHNTTVCDIMVPCMMRAMMTLTAEGDIDREEDYINEESGDNNRQEG